MENILNIKDQIGNSLKFKSIPKRIVSLVPSITYLLYSFDLNDEVVGITRFCKYPLHWKNEKTIIGGTKDFKINKIAALSPDFIIGNKEENTKDKIDELQQIAPVYISDVSDMKTNLNLIRDLGAIFNKKNQAGELINRIESAVNSLNVATKLRTAYLIWQKPYMSVGGDTFIHQMMKIAGFDNVFKNRNRYPAFEINDLKKLRPQVILLSSEPFPFKEKHRIEWQKMFPEAKIILVEGEPFTWFGTYPIQAIPYFKQLNKKL